MRDSMKEAIGETLQGLVDNGIKTSFTKKDFDYFGVVVPEVQLTPAQIKAIREKLHLSQVVFAKMLNISPSSVRQWEQGKRQPTGATKVLLELLNKSPHVLDYRLAAA